jgi:hypothetical protein
MADKTTQEDLSPEELEAQNAQPLPDREAMSVVWIEPTDPTDPPHDPSIKGIPIDYGVEPDKGPEPLGGGEQL